jgi:hypothetical protein
MADVDTSDGRPGLELEAEPWSEASLLSMFKNGTTW